MPPQTQTTTAPSNAYMQSQVQYFLGKTVFGGGGLGLLEWDGDSHIRLFALDPSNGQSKGIIFDCLPSQIRKARATLTNLTLYLNDKTYGMDFSTGALPWLAAGGIFGLFMANRSTKQSGVQWWVDNLKAQGVEVKQFSMVKVLKITLFVILGLFVLLFLIAIVAGGSK